VALHAEHGEVAYLCDLQAQGLEGLGIVAEGMHVLVRGDPVQDIAMYQ
jgi:hypothetical protein